MVEGKNYLPGETNGLKLTNGHRPTERTVQV